MSHDFVRATESGFQLGGRAFHLRSMGVGSLLNLEFFMLGLYGTDAQIRGCLRKVYGEEQAVQFWERWGEVFFGEPDVRFLREAGFNAVRLAFNARLFEPSGGDGGFDERGFGPLDRVVRLCAGQGLRVILDLHSAPGGQNPDWHSDNPTGMALLWEHADHRRRTVELWERIAERYRDEPWVAAYDLLNEPCIHPDRIDELDRLQHQLVAAVRRRDPHHLCFLEGNRYASAFRGLTPVDDDNVAYSWHSYPFFHYLLRSDAELAALDEDAERRGGERYLDHDEELGHVREVLRRPLWCGETGTFYCPELGNTDFHLRTLRGFLEMMDQRSLPWSFWTYKDVGQMGLLRVRPDAAWMRIAARVRSDVSYIQESRLLVAEEAAPGHPFPIHPYTRHVLKRRTIADQQLVMVEKLEHVLRAVPFAELLEAADGFRLDRCEAHPELLRILRGR